MNVDGMRTASDKTVVSVLWRAYLSLRWVIYRARASAARGVELICVLGECIRNVKAVAHSERTIEPSCHFE